MVPYGYLVAGGFKCAFVDEVLAGRVGGCELDVAIASAGAESVR